MKERRQEPRTPRRIPLIFWDREDPGERRTGFTSDTSPSGVFVETNRPLKSGTRIQIEFDRNPGSFLAEGLVVRSISVPPDLRKLKHGGMGVRLLGISELLHELESKDSRNPRPIRASPESGRSSKSSVARPDAEETATEPMPAPSRPKRRTVFEREGASAARRHPAASPGRPEAERASKDEEREAAAPPTYAVAFRTFEDLRQAYEGELSMGGLFVPTDTPALVDDEVNIRLMLPLGRGRIETSARVVQTLSTGMGIVVDDPEGLAANLREILESE